MTLAALRSPRPTAGGVRLDDSGGVRRDGSASGGAVGSLAEAKEAIDESIKLLDELQEVVGGASGR